MRSGSRSRAKRRPGTWRSPVRAFQALSRDETREFRVALQGRSWTTAYEIIESYLAAAEHVLEIDPETSALIKECRELMSDLAGPNVLAPRNIDWAAKKAILDAYRADTGCSWRDAALQAFDLEYHNIDPGEGLYFALEGMGDAERYPSLDERLRSLEGPVERTRAYVRGLAVSKFREHLTKACWKTLTFRLGEDEVEVDLPPNRLYPVQLETATDVGTFIQILRNL